MGGTAPLDLIFGDFVHFLTTLSSFGQNVLEIWSEMFKKLKNQKTQKIVPK